MKSKELAVVSDGRRFENPKPLRKVQAKLKRLQRELSRRRKGGNKLREDAPETCERPSANSQHSTRYTPQGHKRDRRENQARERMTACRCPGRPECVRNVSQPPSDSSDVRCWNERVQAADGIQDEMVWFGTFVL